MRKDELSQELYKKLRFKEIGIVGNKINFEKSIFYELRLLISSIASRAIFLYLRLSDAGS